MPFGLKKGAPNGDLDSQKASLFGKKSSKLAPPAAQGNPYAAQASSSTNPYANQNSYSNDPYARSQSSLTQPPTSSMGSLTLNNEPGALPPGYSMSNPSAQQPDRYEKSPVPPGGYGGGYGGGAGGAPPPARFQNSGSYGQTGGYGDNPYGGGASSSSSNAQQSRYGPSGYGGLGRTTTQDTMSTDAGRSALFGDAPKRAAEAPPAIPTDSYSGAGGGGDNSYTAPGGYGASDMYGGYGAPAPDRELTAEEQEDEDVNVAKQEIRFIKQQDVASTRNIRRMAEEMGVTADSTLERLGQQGERIHNTERNLDSASNQNRLAEEKARELKTLNRSMFAVHVANPFTARKREEAANAIALEKHQKERDQRDATQAHAYQSQMRSEQQMRDINGKGVAKGTGPRNLANRAKYQFEADESDDEKEAEIEENLDYAYQMVRRNHMKAKAMGETIDEQNKHLDRIIKKSDKVDDQITVNRARLDRIR